MTGKSPVRADLDRYAVDLPDPGVESVPAGTSLLVEGGPMTGKQGIALDLLAGTEAAIAVTAGDGAERVRLAFEDWGGDSQRLHVVDCSGSSGGPQFEGPAQVEYVSAPDDLTGVGIGIAKGTRRFGDQVASGLRLGLLGVSTMLQYTAERRLFNFLHVTTGRISAGGYLGVATFDPTAHGEQAANVVRSQFDGVVELRESDAGRELRVRGVGGSREWLPLDG